MNDYKILIVDDEFEELNIIVSFLVEAFPTYRILNASDGKMAWQMVKKHQPQLVLTDWDMPELNGLQLTQLIKSVDAYQNIPVILMTGSMTSSQDLKVALETGTIDYIRKPLDFIELKARMNSALQLFKAQRANQQQHEVIQRLLKEDKERLEQEVATKSRKLTTSTLLAAEKNDLLQRVERELKEVSPLLAAHSSKQRVIQLLTKELATQNRIEKSWDDFKLHFEEVHPHFYQELKSLGASLTNQDLKLAAYLKLNLENKEIAALLGVNAASIRTATYRLKKKLQLSEEVLIREFIRQLG